MNSNILVAELIKELCAYPTQGRCMEQEARTLAPTPGREDSKSWLARLIWPLVWGGDPEERLAEAPSVFQTWEENWGPQAEGYSGDKTLNLKVVLGMERNQWLYKNSQQLYV